MSPTPIGRFEVETPTNWDLPDGPFWVAGWFLGLGDRPVQALRLRLDDRIFAGMCGLPRPEVERRERGASGLPHAGFSFLVQAHRGARLLRLEAFDGRGEWVEFWRTPVRTASTADRPRRPVGVGELADGILTLLKARRANPDGDLRARARQWAVARATEPLDVLPSPPFWGALEEPTALGNSQFNKLPVTGWIVHAERRIVRLLASADPAMEHTLAYGLERADAVAMFPDHPYAARSRFVGLVDLAEDGLDPAGLRIFAELEDGSRHLVFHRHFRQSSCRHKEAALPPFGVATLWKAVLQLRRACRGAGLAPVRWRQWAGAVRKAGAQFRHDAPPWRPLVPPPVAPASLGVPRCCRRLLLVTHNLNLEGAPLFLLEYSGWLGRTLGWTCDVLSMKDGPLRGTFEALGARVTVVDWPPDGPIATREDFAARIAAVGRSIDWSRVDAVVGNTLACWWSVALARSAGRPALLYIHESTTIFRFFERQIPLPLHPLVEEAFRDATRVSFLCRATLDYYEACAGPDNFRIAPGWIDVAAIDRFRRENPRSALRRRHGIGADEVVVANIGSVCERKGQHTFIRAVEGFKRRADAGRRHRFLMVGGREGAYLDLLRSDFPSLGLGDEVVVVPETRDVYDFFGLADLFVCSSYEESFPRVVLEAMAFGVPVVSTDVHGIPEIVRGGREAWLVPAGDPAAMAEAMQRALSEGEAGTRVAAARARVGERFACEAVFPLHLTLLDEVLRPR